ncbi:MAG: Ig-like domain-containing protein, partial [Acidobacteriota bacterium]
DVEIFDHERRFAFQPREPWAAGTYRIVVETILEDVAGNNLEQVFDVEAAVAGSQMKDGRDRVALPFSVE